VSDPSDVADPALERLEAQLESVTIDLAALERRYSELSREYHEWRRYVGDDIEVVDDDAYRSAFRVLRDQYDLSKDLRTLARRRRVLVREIARRRAPVEPVWEVPPRKPQETAQSVSTTARRVAVLLVAGLLPLLAVVAALSVTTDDDRDNADPVDPPLVLVPPKVEVADPIEWTHTLRAIDRGPGCRTVWRDAFRIIGGGRHAGARAVVVFRGRDFPGRPTKTYTVNRLGRFDVNYTTKTCGKPPVRYASLVSLDGDHNVRPRPPR
jgi:hypothetical protein